MKIFDSHFHIIDSSYPLYENNGFMPEDFLVKDYLTRTQELDLEAVGGAVVSGSFQKYDQEYLKASLAKLGSNFVGITQLPLDTTTSELNDLNQAGIKGIRFNLYRGLNESIDDIKSFSNRVYEQHGWTTEFYIDLETISDELFETLLELPRTSVDHLGMSSAGRDKLLLLAKANKRIKVTGFGRIGYEEQELKALLRELYKMNPDVLMFGTDLPSTRARKAFSKDDIVFLEEIFTKKELESVMLTNAKKWYVR